MASLQTTIHLDSRGVHQMIRKGRGWHGESGRHANAARGITTKAIHRKAHEDVLTVADYIADALDWHPDVTVHPSILPRFERGIEDILVLLERNLGPKDLSLKTATGETVKEELERAREGYELSFTYPGPVDRFAALEEARERLHAITSKLTGLRRLGEKHE